MNKKARKWVAIIVAAAIIVPTLCAIVYSIITGR